MFAAVPRMVARRMAAVAKTAAARPSPLFGFARRPTLAAAASTPTLSPFGQQILASSFTSTFAKPMMPRFGRMAGGLRSRFHTLMGREYRPSRFMVRAKKFSSDTSAAASTATGSLMRFPKEHPFATNIIVATIKTSACDILVQKYVEGKDEINWARVSVFTAFGCLYLGFFQWALYVTLFSRLFPGMAKFANLPWKEKLKDRRGIINVIGQSAFDNFIHYTFIYFPVFYVFKEAIQGTGYEKTISSVVGKSLGKYQDNFVEDNLKIYALWLPGDMIIYSAPMWLRLPLNHALSFIWTCYLSFLRGAKTEEVTDGEEAAQEGEAEAAVDAQKALEDERAEV